MRLNSGVSGRVSKTTKIDIRRIKNTISGATKAALGTRVYGNYIISTRWSVLLERVGRQRLSEGVGSTFGELVSQLRKVKGRSVDVLNRSANVEGATYSTLSTRLPVLVPGHEDTGTTGRLRALPSESLDAALRVDLVVLENGHLDLLSLVLDLLGGGVVLLLPLLGSSSETQDEVEGGLLLDVCERGKGVESDGVTQG